MSDSYSAGKYAEAADKEMAKKDCKDGNAHDWKPQTPFYGASQCTVCKKVVYTK
jgi:hypothetical protein